MDICKKLFTVALALMFVLCSGVVFADEVETTKPNEKITTEYYSDDLNEPLYFDATETVASIGAVLEIPAKSCVLIEVSTGKVLYENESHMKLAPASITKVMALLLTMEAIESGQLTVDMKLRASEHACSMGGSQIWLEPGEEMSVDDLLKAAVIGSANDATVVLGEAIAGSEEGFVAMMNERAKKLGMTNTAFENCSGLDDTTESHYTTARDIAIMSCELMKHEKIKEYTTIWMDSLRNGETELVNTNRLIRFYEGATGL